MGPVVGIAWFPRHQFQITDEFFRGDTWAFARWIQDAEYNRPVLTISEFNALLALAIDAGS
jgi:hypothetical protein